MDIQHLVDRLEELLNGGKHVPFSQQTLIDEQRGLELIDQMRISIPEEIEKAKRILRERDRIMAQANEFIAVLERINTVGMAVQILDSIPEDQVELKNSTRSNLVALLAGMKPNLKTPTV